jgi:hypothetical protein
LSQKKTKFIVIPAKAGIQKVYFRRNAPPFFDWQPFWLEKTNWIPAFAGMTGLCVRDLLQPSNGKEYFCYPEPSHSSRF